MHDELLHLESIGEFYTKGDYMDQLLAMREVELIQRHCRNRDNALEVGCGYGYVTEQVYNFFSHYEVVEPARTCLNTMQQRIKASFPCHNVLLEAFASTRRWDNILFLNVIEHVEDPIASLKQLSNLLRDEGRLFVSAPNCMALNRRAGFRMGLLPSFEQFAPKDIALGHRRLYTVEMMREHCEAAGLRVESLLGIYLKPLSEKQMVELGDAAVRAFYSLGEEVPEYCANLFAVATKKYY
jgi:2-polyprenyl-3-methyl-5-hydroxy-6-metoxy-1,4-benzoquinol methylase